MNCAECFQPIQKGQKYFRRPSGKHVHEHCPSWNEPIAIDGIMLRKEGADTIVEVDIGDHWVIVIRELSEGNFSHIIEPDGIRGRFEDDRMEGLGLRPKETEEDSQKGEK